MTRHHAESNNILLTRYFPIDSGVRPWSHLLMTPLHCLCAKSNNRTSDQFECDVTWFCFCFDFVRSHARCSCCSIVCWRGWKEGEGGGGGGGGGGRGSFKIGRPRSRGWKYFRHCWTRGVGGLENMTVFTDVICVSSLMSPSFTLYGFRDIIDL